MLKDRECAGDSVLGPPNMSYYPLANGWSHQGLKGNIRKYCEGG